jgi:predicted RNase H-like HicB family nuclease
MVERETTKGGSLTESILLRVRLQAFTKQAGKHVVAGCPSLNVVSQGKDKADAERCLKEAVQVWFESCLERGVLEQALQEVGFRPAPWGVPAEAPGESIEIYRTEDEALLGEPFQVSVEIPAFLASSLLSNEARL